MDMKICPVIRLWDKDLPGHAAFKASVRFYEIVSYVVLEDDRLHIFLSKKEITTLKRDIRNSVNYLYKLNPNTKHNIYQSWTFQKWTHIFDSWYNKVLCKGARKLIRKDSQEDWRPVSLALQNLIDGYFHLFAKFIVSSDKKCFWCGSSLGEDWNLVLSKLMNNNALLAYLHLKTSYSDNLIDNNIANLLEDIKILLTCS